MTDPISDIKNMRCGDVVFHRPTGETWKVAYADHETGRMSWLGWPSGEAEIDDCKILKVASDSEHKSAVKAWLGTNKDDWRRRIVRRLYGSAT